MYWKIFKILIPYLIGALIAGMAVWKIQQVRVGNEKNARIKVEADYKICKDANVTNTSTITMLKTDADEAQKDCDNRLKDRDKRLQDLQKIDTFKPGEAQPRGGKDEGKKDIPVFTGDDICDYLNFMYHN
jgi:uncharacterized protein HemX